MKTPKLYRVIIPVSDIKKAERFYSFILGIKGERVSHGRCYFNCGGTILACYDPIADGDNFKSKPNPDNVYIAVKNLEETYDKAKKINCLYIDNKIRKRPWGERSFYIKDPFGNPICFVDYKTIFTS